MTAIVGVLNKHGVALAADSAVTVNVHNGRKILNSANKIIRLSKRKPMAIMIYSGASLLSTPWDLIIKMYRDDRVKANFDTGFEYVSDFITYLKEHDYFSNKEVEDRHFEKYVLSLYDLVTQNALEEIGSSITDENKEFLNAKIEEGLKLVEQHCMKRSRCPDFEDYSFENFKEEYHQQIYKMLESKIDASVDKDSRIEVVERAIFASIVSSAFIGPMTGLVFVGYGCKEIFPTLVPLNVSLVVSGRLKCAIDEANIAIIGDGKNQYTASIRPFAQKDVINTILSGVDDRIHELYVRVTDAAITNFRQTIADTVRENEPENEKVVQTIMGIDTRPIINDIIDHLDKFIQREYVSQLMDTVEYLDKEDLASMAESLIALTSLKRRMTSSEESVGGPVDVAVITKGDGFVWIKHKMYFDKDLNKPYFENYDRD